MPKQYVQILFEMTAMTRFWKYAVSGLSACLLWQGGLAAVPGIPVMQQKLIDDCQCEEGIREIRKGWGQGRWRHPGQKDYLPYYLAGAFTGKPGFAALFCNASAPFAAKIVVFALPQGRSHTLDFPFADEGSLEQVGLFRTGHELLVGTFGSEAEPL
jgi:hypothetical protein